MPLYPLFIFVMKQVDSPSVEHNFCKPKSDGNQDHWLSPTTFLRVLPFQLLSNQYEEYSFFAVDSFCDSAASIMNSTTSHHLQNLLHSHQSCTCPPMSQHFICTCPFWKTFTFSPMVRTVSTGRPRSSADRRVVLPEFLRPIRTIFSVVDNSLHTDDDGGDCCGVLSIMLTSIFGKRHISSRLFLGIEIDRRWCCVMPSRQWLDELFLKLENSWRH